MVPFKPKPIWVQNLVKTLHHDQGHDQGHDQNHDQGHDQGHDPDQGRVRAWDRDLTLIMTLIMIKNTLVLGRVTYKTCNTIVLGRVRPPVFFSMKNDVCKT